MRPTRCGDRGHVVLGLDGSGQITVRRVDGWQTLDQVPSDSPLDLAA